MGGEEIDERGSVGVYCKSMTGPVCTFLSCKKRLNPLVSMGYEMGPLAND